MPEDRISRNRKNRTTILPMLLTKLKEKTQDIEAQLKILVLMIQMKKIHL